VVQGGEGHAVDLRVLPPVSDHGFICSRRYNTTCTAKEGVKAHFARLRPLARGQIVSSSIKPAALSCHVPSLFPHAAAPTIGEARGAGGHVAEDGGGAYHGSPARSLTYP